MENIGKEEYRMLVFVVGTPIRGAVDVDPFNLHNLEIVRADCHLRIAPGNVAPRVDPVLSPSCSFVHVSSPQVLLSLTTARNKPDVHRRKKRHFEKKMNLFQIVSGQEEEGMRKKTNKSSCTCCVTSQMVLYVKLIQGSFLKPSAVI